MLKIKTDEGDKNEGQSNVKQGTESRYYSRRKKRKMIFKLKDRQRTNIERRNIIIIAIKYMFSQT